MPEHSRLRRSLHFVPGGNERFFEKALTLPADALILDLEDAVTAAGKTAARVAVARWLREADFGGRERIVRINPLDSPWGRADLEAIAEASPDTYLIPKVRGPDDLREIDRRLTRLEAGDREPAGLLALATETAEGLLRIGELGRCPRVEGLTWGPEDLSAELGASRTRAENGAYLDVFRYARSMTLLGAAAAGVLAIDTVYVEIRDTQGLRDECREAAWMGFVGKLTLHPDQIGIVNDAFTPSDQEIARSRELIEAFEAGSTEGGGAIRFQGRMVDAPHVARARRLLERARLAGGTS